MSFSDSKQFSAWKKSGLDNEVWTGNLLKNEFHESDASDSAESESNDPIGIFRFNFRRLFSLI